MATQLFSGIGDQFPPLKTDMWSIVFPEEMGISERFQVQASRPKISNTVIDVKYKHSTTKYKGATKYENMQVVFRDVVGPGVMQKFWMWQKEHYDPKTGCGGYPSVYKKNIILYMEDDCGNPVQKWILYGCFLGSLDGGGLDMKSDGEIATVSMDIAYDYPELIF